MAKIRTIPERDEYGEGYKQEITLDNGKSYKIQTTPTSDPYGDGYIKEIVENDASNLSGESLLGPLIGAVVLISIALWPIPTLIIIGIIIIGLIIYGAIG